MIDHKQDTWPDSWKLLEHGIRTGRYTDPEFCKLEHEKLWLNVWQMATRVDAVAEPGDYAVYDIGHQSVIVVRNEHGEIKAFNNACPHRGTALAEGNGQFEKCRIICPFHGWRWDVDGNNQYVLEEQQFRDGKLTKDDVALREVAVEVYAGFVFVNFSKDPAPFADFISPFADLLDDLATGEMRHYWWKSVEVPANWKVAVEAFLEGYHVPATHPQLETTSADFIYGDDVSGQPPQYSHLDHIYETFEHGHGRFLGGEKTPMAGHTRYEGDPVDLMADRLNLLVEGMDAMVLAEDVALVRSLKGKEIPEGSTLGAEYVKLLYATAAEQGRPMPKPEKHVLNMWGGELFIFPNLLVLPQAGNTMIYRVRPNGFNPDSCIFEILSTKTYPKDQQPPRTEIQEMTDVDDPEQFRQIPRQDFSNIPRIQKGLHTQGCKQVWMADYYEKIIMNMHQELDRYLSDQK
ncbi:aromatic ring-hydroxylating dioxygenase subunit alpha [Spongiibacter nanhainus]|uniref:Aromatic ring-hydroxylating dioxygenase subunit alpha n=1 Tax=Spongiibacter nanhainus TaxID=2794344 RepID=A0A7T4QYX7_9GAMM|nr:aromatic ring-hydroxylating dioxygenase subunit alpha [Spongiibacter nanhainus]QQD17249.1 aromatic ring-hydroxylating dioxygenase subunit alpha [Spongiibacter nanhainus]